MYSSLISLGILPHSNRLPFALASCVAALHTTLDHIPSTAHSTRTLVCATLEYILNIASLDVWLFTPWQCSRLRGRTVDSQHFVMSVGRGNRKNVLTGSIHDRANSDIPVEQLIACI